MKDLWTWIRGYRVDKMGFADDVVSASGDVRAELLVGDPTGDVFVTIKPLPDGRWFWVLRRRKTR